MAAREKVDYDQENDILFVSLGKKAESSIEVDNYVIDISKGDKIVGLEIMDASKTISNMIQKSISKEDLSNITRAKLKPISGKELVFIILTLFYKKRNESESLTMQVPTRRVTQLAVV